MTSHPNAQEFYAAHRRAWGRTVAFRNSSSEPQPRSAGRPKSYKDADMVAEQHMCGEHTDRGYNSTTSSGLPFWPTSPHPEDIRFTDIANGLARICRFNGQLDPAVEHYSVAQHSVLVSYLVPQEFALEALLHDAAEAYVGDMIRPLKLQDEIYRAAEHQIDQVIRAKFGLPAELSPEVKHADNVMAATERRDLLSEQIGVDWGVMPDPSPKTIRPLRAFEARDLFFERAMELDLTEVVA